MPSPQEHYRRAETYADRAEVDGLPASEAAFWASVAQVHATLATAPATYTTRPVRPPSTEAALTEALSGKALL